MYIILILILISNLTIAGAILFSKLYTPKQPAPKVITPPAPAKPAEATPKAFENAFFPFDASIAQTMQLFNGLDITPPEQDKSSKERK